ncbi:MAG: hypothetical protein WDN10_01440 [bacterium]
MTDTFPTASVSRTSPGRGTFPVRGAKTISEKYEEERSPLPSAKHMSLTLLVGVILAWIMGVFSPEEYFGAIRNNIRGKRYLYATIRIFAGLGSLLIFIGAIVGAFHAFNIFNIQVHQNRVELDSYYRKTTELTSTDGTYTTTFRIFVHTPPYWTPPNPKNLEAGFNFYWLGNPQAECSDPASKGFSEKYAGSYSSSTREYEMTCRTYSPVLDNGRLIMIREN